MFARRVYEAMACGCLVIRNDSQGLREQFGSRIWYAGEPFQHMREDDICLENILEVFDKHTWTVRVKQLLEIIESELV
jgi:spore maturation protein CgeB